MHKLTLELDEVNAIFKEFELDDLEQTRLLNALKFHQYRYRKPEKGGNKYHWHVAKSLLLAESHQFPSPMDLFRYVHERLDYSTTKEAMEASCFQQMERTGLLAKGYGYIRLTKVGYLFLSMTLREFAPEYVLKAIDRALATTKKGKPMETTKAKVTYPYLLDVLSPKYIEVIEKYVDKLVAERVANETQDLQDKIDDYEAALRLIGEVVENKNE